MNANIPYGSEMLVKNKAKLKKGDVICRWDPYNAVIISEAKGKIHFENIIDGVTFREEVDEQTGFTEKVITETRDKKKMPAIHVIEATGIDLQHIQCCIGDVLRDHTITFNLGVIPDPAQQTVGYSWCTPGTASNFPGTCRFTFNFQQPR